MSNILTYNNLVDIFTDISSRHQQINTFFLGKDYKLGSSQEIQYPLFQMSPSLARLPRNAYGEYKTIQIDLECKVFDLVQQSQANEKDVQSDMLQVATDIINELNQHPYYIDSNVTLLNDIQIDILDEFESDYTAGVSFTLSLQLINNNSFCGLPFDPIEGLTFNGAVSTGYTYTATLSCADLVSCPIIVDLGNDITEINSILSGLTGGTISTGNYWTSGSTGTNSIKAINSTGLDATGNNSVAIGSGTTSQSESSFAAGIGSLAKASEDVVLNKDVYSGITMTNNDPLYNAYAIIFNGDVTLEWQDYIYSFCPTFTLYNGSGSTQTFDCSNIYDIYYDIPNNITYIVDGDFVDDSFTSISGNTDYNTSIQYPAFAMGINVTARAKSAFATGNNTRAVGNYATAQGDTTTAQGESSHSEGQSTQAIGVASHSEGSSTLAQGNYSHSEGQGTKASGVASHSEGQGTTASGYYTHAEGTGSIASGDASHAEGYANLASGIYGSHAEGSNSTASGAWSHAEGGLTTASGAGSHSEGFRTTASGQNSHAGGGANTIAPFSQTIASGEGSFVHGSASTSSGSYSIVLGSNITGTSFNTVYVNKLNIKTLPTGTTINNLGIDASGNIIVGSTGSTFSGSTNYYSKFTSGGTLSNGMVYDNGVSSGLNIAASGDNINVSIISPSGYYYPSLTFVNNGVTTVGQITAYGGRLYTSPLSVNGTIDMGANKIVNMSPATNQDDAINLGQLSNTTVISTSTACTININSFNTNYSVTALTSACTFSVAGSFSNFDKLIIRIKDNGTAQALTFDPTYFEAKGMALPTTTVASKLLTAGFIYDNITNKYGCVTVAQEL